MSPLYNALNTWLGQSLPWDHRAHLTTCLFQGLELTSSPVFQALKDPGSRPDSTRRSQPNSLATLPALPWGTGPKQQRRVSRWLHNSRINIHRLYKPLIQAALATRGEACLYLSLDTSLWQEYCLVRLSVVYRGRALPIIWRVLKHDSASVAFEAYWEMLCQGAQRLPAGVKVVLLADRGFVHLKAMKLITTTLGWHYRIRIKRNTWIWRSSKGWRQLKEIHLQRGEARCFHTVKVHRRD